MQFNDNSDTSVALADALKAGNTREVTFNLLADWDRDGTFSNAYSDLSDNLVEASLDAQFTGNYPDALEVNDGYAQRRMTATLTGEIGDTGVDVVRYFSPFSSQYGGSIGTVNTPIKMSVNVLTSRGPVEIRQFTGFILQAKPSRKDGTVELTLADITSQLTNGISFQTTGRSMAKANWQMNVGDETRNTAMRTRGGQLLSWYMIDACRKSGLYQGPPAPPESVWYSTLAGGNLPEVGGFWQMQRDSRVAPGDQYSVLWQITASQPMYFDQTDPSNLYQPNSIFATEIDTTYAYPNVAWERGTYGPVMKRDVYDPTRTPYCVDPMHDNGSGTKTSWGVVDHMTGIYCTSKPVYVAPTTTQSCRIGIGGYYNFDSSVNPGNYLEAQVMFPGISDGGEYGHVYVKIVPSQSYAALEFSRTPSGAVVPSHQYQYFFTVPDGEAYVGFNVELRTGQKPNVQFKWNDTLITGVPATGSTTSTLPTMDMGASKYKNMNQRGAGYTHQLETSWFYFRQTGGASHWGLWYQDNGSTSRPFVWSDAASQPFTPQTDIGPSMARVMYSPPVKGSPAWDVIKEIGSADLGVIYTDEYGMLRYSNWLEVQQERDSGDETFELSLDELASLDPFTTFDSVINKVSYSYKDRAFRDKTIYSADGVDDFLCTPQRWSVYKVGTSDVVSILIGDLEWRPVAQGYPSPLNTGGTKSAEIGGTTQYLRTDWMKAYPPEKWASGFTSHNLGDTTVDAGGGVGVPYLGVSNVPIIAVGWGDGDNDPSRMTIYVWDGNNSGGKISRLSIDDNTPFMQVRGFALEDILEGTETVEALDNGVSEATFGPRLLERPQSDWTTDYNTQNDLSVKLATDCAQPRPMLESIELLGDPRRQLQDVVRISDPDLMGGPIWASVVGINRKFSVSDGISETLTLRTAKNRGGSWELGSADFSQLGSTTIL